MLVLAFKKSAYYCKSAAHYLHCCYSLVRLTSSYSAIPPLPQLLTKRTVFLPEGETRLSEKSELKLKPGCQFVTSLPPLSYLCFFLKKWSRQCSCTSPRRYRQHPRSQSSLWTAWSLRFVDSLFSSAPELSGSDWTQPSTV